MKAIFFRLYDLESLIIEIIHIYCFVLRKCRAHASWHSYSSIYLLIVYSERCSIVHQHLLSLNERGSASRWHSRLILICFNLDVFILILSLSHYTQHTNTPDRISQTGFICWLTELRILKWIFELRGVFNVWSGKLVLIYCYLVEYSNVRCWHPMPHCINQFYFDHKISIFIYYRYLYINDVPGNIDEKSHMSIMTAMDGGRKRERDKKSEVQTRAHALQWYIVI